MDKFVHVSLYVAFILTFRNEEGVELTEHVVLYFVSLENSLNRGVPACFELEDP